MAAGLVVGCSCRVVACRGGVEVRRAMVLSLLLASCHWQRSTQDVATKMLARLAFGHKSKHSVAAIPVNGNSITALNRSARVSHKQILHARADGECDLGPVEWSRRVLRGLHRASCAEVTRELTRRCGCGATGEN